MFSDMGFTSNLILNYLSQCIPARKWLAAPRAMAKYDPD